MTRAAKDVDDQAGHGEEQFLWAQVEQTLEHRAEHPDEVMTVSADELDRLRGG